MNALQHAGCGGPIVRVDAGIACETCSVRITDPLELTPHGGWEGVPTVAVARAPQTGVVLE